MMRQFIYLDTDMVNSIIAQKDKGLAMNLISETEQAASQVVDVGGQAQIEGGVEGGLFKLVKVHGKLGLSREKHSQDKQESVLREIETKTLHDAAYDIAYEHIKDRIMGENDEIYYGSFIEMKKYFTFTDFEYMEKVFLSEELVSAMQEEGKKKINDASKNMLNDVPRERRKSATQEIIKKEREILNGIKNQYDNIGNMIKLLRTIIPYNRMLVADEGFIMPLEDKFLRDNPSTIGFKHGGEFTCVGYITNLIGDDSEPSDENVFKSLQYKVNELLRTFLPTKEAYIYIVHPIALYYE